MLRQRGGRRSAQEELQCRIATARYVAERGWRKACHGPHQHQGGELRAGLGGVVAIGSMQSQAWLSGMRVGPGLRDRCHAGRLAAGNAGVKVPDPVDLVDAFGVPEEMLRSAELVGWPIGADA